MKMNVFTNYYMEQRYNESVNKYFVRVFVNDSLIEEKINSNPYEYENIKVYMSDQWYQPPDVIIKDFKFGTFDSNNRRKIV